MKKAAIIPAVALFFAMLASCSLFPDFDLNDLNDNLPETLEEGFFYTQNIVTGKFYVIEAEELYKGEKCVIWAEKDSSVTVTEAGNIANEYDNKIRPRIIAAFNNEISDGQDILDYANELVGRDDKKLTILLLDIKDGFEPNKNESYVAGYFYQVDFLKKGKYRYGRTVYCSNGRDMIYVDINPGLREHATQTYSTFAHELQHLVNYATRHRLKRGTIDLWINEGLSAYAEYIYLENNPDDKCLWLNDSRNTVKTGNNFFVWDNHKGRNENPLAIIDDYATVYLFFRWLYLQADTDLQSHIFRDITRSNSNNYQAVTDVAINIDSTWGSWETLLGTWFAANYDPKNAVYGYKNDRYLQDGYGVDPKHNYKGIRVTPIGGSTRPLYPGEGVYSINSNGFSPAAKGNIRYAQLNGNTQNYLLTFNANANNKAGIETGSLTGVSPSVAASRTAADDSQSERWAGPFVIDARDLLARNQR